MKSNYEYELISKVMKEIDILLMPNHASRIKNFTQSDYESLEHTYAMLERLYNNIGKDVPYAE